MAHDTVLDKAIGLAGLAFIVLCIGMGGIVLATAVVGFIVDLLSVLA